MLGKLIIFLILVFITVMSVILNDNKMGRTIKKMHEMNPRAGGFSTREIIDYIGGDEATVRDGLSNCKKVEQVEDSNGKILWHYIS